MQIHIGSMMLLLLILRLSIATRNCLLNHLS